MKSNSLPSLSRNRLLSLAWIALALNAGAETIETNQIRRPLSLNDCIALSLENNLDLRIERHEPRIAEYRWRALRGVYDPVFTVYAKRDFLDQPARVNPDNLRRQTFIDAQGQPVTITFIDTQNPYEQTVDAVGGGFTGKLPTGMEYELAVVSDGRAITAFPLPGELLPHGQTNDAFASVAFTLRQPLLKNLWIDADRLNLQLAKRDLQISETDLRAGMMTNVADVMVAYYDLIYARETVRVNQKALDLARQLFAETHRRVQVGDLSKLDESQTESLVETIQADIVAAQQLEAEKQNDLKLLISDNLVGWLGVDIIPIESLVVVPEVFDRQASWEAALLNRPDLEEVRLELEKRRILVRYSRNQLYPNLELIGGVGLQYYGTNPRNAWAQVADGERPYYSVGLMLSFPLSRTTARNQYKASLEAKEQTELRLRKKELKAMSAIDMAAKAINSAFRRVEATRKARAYSEEALTAEEKKFRNGASTSFLVQEQQRNLTGARTAEVQAMADYHKARTQLQLEEGTILSRNKISVDFHQPRRN